MRLYRSPLFDQIEQYFSRSKEDEQIFLYVPYIKTKILSELVKNLQNKIIVITTLKPNDLLSGSSELELFKFCKEKKITLYVNNKIHLKIYSVNLQNAIISTANISKNGLLPDGNYEAATFVDKLTSEDKLYLEQIRNEAILINDEIYLQLKKWYDEQNNEIPKEVKFEELISYPKKDFLISALPMTRNIQDLVEGYVRINSGLEPSFDSEVSSCIYHDLANYNIELGLTKSEFMQKLKTRFFGHPFIKKIDEFIDPEAYFGRIKEWIQNNCADVPIPSRRELTGNVQVLLEWFENLGDGKYVIDIPGSHSQRIRKMM